MPLASSRRTTSESVSGALTAPDWLSPLTFTSEVGAAGSAVMANTTGEPFSPPAVAVAPCAPAVGPSVRCVAAVPFAAVGVDAGLTEPPPVGPQVTAVPLTELPYRSVTLTTRESVRGAPTSADWLFPRAANTVSAAAASAVASKFRVSAPPEVAPITMACIRCAPAVVPRIHRAPVRPSASVKPVSGTASPPPSVGVNTTFTPSTGLLSESVTRTRAESGSGAATVAVWPFPETSVRAAGRPSLGNTRLSLLHVTAAAARTTGQTNGRILKDKGRCSVCGDGAQNPHSRAQDVPDRGEISYRQNPAPATTCRNTEGCRNPRYCGVATPFCG